MTAALTLINRDMFAKAGMLQMYMAAATSPCILPGLLMIYNAAAQPDCLQGDAPMSWCSARHIVTKS